MTKTEIFLEKYKELEKEAVSAYHYPQDGSAVSRLERRKEFKDIAVELSYCRDVRNLLAHNQRIGESFAVEPSDAMIALMEETLEKVKNPVRCVDVWVPFNKMIWRTKKDNVLQTMQVMRSAGFSHVPILDNRRVTGVFSASTVFNHLIEGNQLTVQESSTFAEIEEALRLDAHGHEGFAFLPLDARLCDAEDLYMEAFKQTNENKRIVMFFLTQNGNAGEKVEGLMTLLDLLGN